MRVGSLRRALPAVIDRLRRVRFTADDRRTLLRALVASAITLWVFWVLAGRLTFSPTSSDEDSFLWTGWSVTKGLVPFRDFHDFKPHMIFFSNALALEIFGLAGQRYRLFFTLLAGSSLLLLAISLSVRKVHAGITAAVVFFICFLWVDPGSHDSSFDDAESIGMSYYLLGVSCVFLGRGARAAARFSLANFLGGVLLSFAVLSKEPFALCVLPTWLCLLAWNFADGPGRAKAKQYAKSTLTGVALVLSSLLGYLLVTRSLMAYIHGLQLYIPFSSTICITFGVWKPSGFKADWIIRLARLQENLVNFPRLGIALPLLVAPFALVSRKTALVTALAALTALGGLYAVTLGGCFFHHYYMLGMIGLFFLMGVGAQMLNGESIGLRGRIRTYLGVALPALCLWALWPRISAELGAVHVPGGPRESAALRDFIEKNTTPSDTIFTTGWHGIYVHTNRLPAIGESTYFDAFLTLYPGKTDEERVKPLYDQMVKNRPKIIIIERSLAEKRERHMAALVMPFVRNHGYREDHEPGIPETMYIRPD
jgi:hypothetical protein